MNEDIYYALFLPRELVLSLTRKENLSVFPSIIFFYKKILEASLNLFD